MFSFLTMLICELLQHTQTGCYSASSREVEKSKESGKDHTLQLSKLDDEFKISKTGWMMAAFTMLYCCSSRTTGTGKVGIGHFLLLERYVRTYYQLVQWLMWSV